MEKNGITSLDLKFLVKEFKELLIGGFFRKIYQYEKKQFLFEIFNPGKGAFWLYVDNNKIFITKHKSIAPKIPLNFCMFLRKHLMGKKIRDIRRHEFDRILEIITDQNVLIFELLNPGNVILCDSSYKIIMPLEIQRWRDREVKPKLPYKYPPKRINPFKLDINNFKKFLKFSDKKIIIFLAVELGFGAVYAKEICLRTKINEEKVAHDIGFDEVARLYDLINSLDKIVRPCVYENIATVFPLTGLEPVKIVKTCSLAFDLFYSKKFEAEAEEKKLEIIEEEEKKEERILVQRKKATKKWTDVRSEKSEKAELLYNYYDIVQAVLNGIKKARDTGLSWKELKEKIKTEQTPEAEVIKEIREGDAIVVLNLDDEEIEIDFRKSVEENAANYFESAKKAKKKLVGIAKIEREEVKKTGPLRVGFVEKKPKKPRRKRRKWFEKFKYFISSDRFLVVAGKTAAQNEELYKKRADDTDFVCHADIQGAAFVLIKSGGKEVSYQTKKEAAEFGAVNSKAWARGLGNIDVFCVPKTQVTKPISLPKGSFVIVGEREWFRKLELKLSIGIKILEEAKLIIGPVMAVRKNSDYFVTIKPGFKAGAQFAREIKNKILIKARPEHKILIEKIELKEFEDAIPSNKGDIVQYG